MKLDKSVIEKIIDLAVLDELDYLYKLDLIVKPGDSSQSVLVEGGK